MKKILPILLIFILIVSACSGEKEEKKKDAKKESNQIVEADGTLNLKNYLHKKGNVAFLVRNTDGSQTLDEKTKVDAIIVSKGKEMQVFNTGFEEVNSLLLEDINKMGSNKQAADMGKIFDKALLERDLKYMNETHKKGTDRTNKKNEDWGKETHEFIPLTKEYTLPEDRKLVYEEREEHGKKAIFMNVKPRTWHNNTSNYYEPKLRIVYNSDIGYNFTEMLPLTEAGNKKYIGISTVANDQNEAKMVIVEAPKGTKKISSGL